MYTFYCTCIYMYHLKDWGGKRIIKQLLKWIHKIISLVYEQFSRQRNRFLLVCRCNLYFLVLPAAEICLLILRCFNRPRYNFLTHQCHSDPEAIAGVNCKTNNQGRKLFTYTIYRLVHHPWYRWGIFYIHVRRCRI